MSLKLFLCRTNFRGTEINLLVEDHSKVHPLFEKDVLSARGPQDENGQRRTGPCANSRAACAATYGAHERASGGIDCHRMQIARVRGVVREPARAFHFVRVQMRRKGCAAVRSQLNPIDGEAKFSLAAEMRRALDSH